MARKVTINVTGAVPLDAFRSVANVVADTERQYELKGAYNATTNKQGVVDITTKEKIVTGPSPNEIHVFMLTQVMATGTYTFAYKASYPTIEVKKEADAVPAE